MNINDLRKLDYEAQKRQFKAELHHVVLFFDEHAKTLLDDDITRIRQAINKIKLIGGDNEKN